MDYTQSLPEPLLEPDVCRCQICLYIRTLEEELVRDRVAIASLQDEQSRTESQFQDFQLQTQRKLKMVDRKLNENDEVVKRTKLATERLG